MLKTGISSSPRSPVGARSGPRTAAATAAASSPLASPPPPSSTSPTTACAALRRATPATSSPRATPATSSPRAPLLATGHAWPAAVSTISGSNRPLCPPVSALPTSVEAAASSTKHHKSNHHHSSNGSMNGNGNGKANGNGHNSRGGGDVLGVQDPVLARDGSAAATVRVHIIVPRCTTVPGEHLVLVGDCEALGRWDVRGALRLGWCSGHMHTATFALPADWQSLKAKLVLVHGGGGQGQAQVQAVSWEPGHDRSIVLQPPRGDAADGGSSSNGNGRGNGRGAAVSASRGAMTHDYVVVCHWGHTEATSVLAREVPGEVLVLEQQLSAALSELRSARSAAMTSQEKLQRMAQDLASSERAARQSAEQLAELQAKHSAMTSELTEAKRQAKAAAAEAAAAAAKAAAAAQASSVNVAEVEARVSQRYEGRMAELKQQLEGVKAQYSSEVSALQQKLEVSLSKEAEAQEMVNTLREIVHKDVARLRTELAQLVNEYIAARQQLQEQAQQIEASEKLRMQQIDGLSSEIKNLITKYNSAQNTIAEQQRLLEELQASRGVALPPRHTDPVQQVAIPPAPDSQAGRGWRADWARLSKLSANGGAQTVNAAASASTR